jgi:hypothetical protein
MPFAQVDVADPLFLESKTYHATDDRKAWADFISEGIVQAADFQVVGAGGLAVSVGGGTAYVKGTSITDEGMYRVYQGTTVTGLVSPAADGSLPRVDTVVLRIKNSTVDTTGAQKADLVMVPGTPTSGANLSNLSGVPNVESAGVEGSKAVMVLAYALVPAGSSSITSILDARNRASVGGGNALNAGNVSIATTVAGLAPYINGKPGRIKITLGSAYGASVSNLEYVDVIYDSAYGKWVSAPLMVMSTVAAGISGAAYLPVPTGGAYAGPDELRRTAIWVPTANHIAAGLTPQVSFKCGVSTDINDGTLYASVFYRYVNANAVPSAWTQVAGSEWVSATPPTGAAADAIRVGGWATVGVGAYDVVQYTIMAKKVGGTGNVFITGGNVWMRWVG